MCYSSLLELAVYVTGNIDFAVQIDPMILLVELVRFNLNRSMEFLQDQSVPVLVWINLN